MNTAPNRRMGVAASARGARAGTIASSHGKAGTDPRPRKTVRRGTYFLFRANEVRLQLSVLAYNLGNLWRRRVLPKRIDTWSLTSLQQRLVKTGGCLVYNGAHRDGQKMEIPVHAGVDRDRPTTPNALRSDTGAPRRRLPPR